jgi:hypothetical protein
MDFTPDAINLRLTGGPRLNGRASDNRNVRVMPYCARQRAEEIGVRMTLGARPLEVAWPPVAQAPRPRTRIPRAPGQCSASDPAYSTAEFPTSNRD